MSKSDEIRRLLDGIYLDTEKAVKEAYEDGFNAGVGVTPDPKAFHLGHLEPRDYGEDGEIYVLSGRFSEDKALKIFNKYFREQGFDEIESVRKHLISVASDPDDEYQYYYNASGKGGIYEAWVWTA